MGEEACTGRGGRSIDNEFGVDLLEGDEAGAPPEEEEPVELQEDDYDSEDDAFLNEETKKQSIM